MKFKDYIFGSRKGKEAHRIELEAMKDPFLSDALEGYDMLRDANLEMRIQEMEAKVKGKTQKKVSLVEVFSIAASILVLIGLSVYLLMNNHPELNERTAIHQGPKPLKASHVLVVPEAEPFIDMPIEGEPKPVPGKKAYKQYVEESLFIPAFDECRNTKGKVVVAFKVNAKGRPYDLDVKKSLCPTADQEALRVVKEGPSWTLGDKIVNVTITF